MRPAIPRRDAWSSGHVVRLLSPAANRLLFFPDQAWTDPAMIPSHYLKPAIAVAFFVALAAGDWWWEHRPEPVEREPPSLTEITPAISTNACFSDQVHVAGTIVPRREAVVGVDQEGSR